MNDNIAPGVKDALDYLKSGGLGEVIGMTAMSLENGHQKVQSDTDMIMALCVMASEAVKFRETLEWYADEVMAYSITQANEPRSAVHGDRGKRARDALSMVSK